MRCVGFVMSDTLRATHLITQYEYCYVTNMLSTLSAIEDRQILDEIVVQHVFVDGPDVLTWFDLHTTVAPPAPTANWQHIENGKITRIRVTFDPRALTGG